MKHSATTGRLAKAALPIGWGAVAAAACSVIVAVVMAFGNPFLWTTAQQSLAQRYAPGTDADDYAFIDRAAGRAEASQLSCLGSYKAISQVDDEARATNIALAAEALDGLEIEPGQTLSVNETLGDTLLDERYVEAPVLDGASTQRARGGGVCQVSTALYIAALESGLEVVERHPHTVVVDYAPIGLDATLSFGQKDLRIKNASPASVFVHAEALGQTVEVKIYGAARVDGVELDATSRIVDRSEAMAKDAYDDPAAEGLRPDDVVTCYRAEAQLVAYRDGTKESCELLSEDAYVAVSEGASAAGRDS